MTIQEALDRIDSVKPNMVPPETKIAWLSDLDGQIWREIIQTHNGRRPYNHQVWPGDPLDQGGNAPAADTSDEDSIPVYNEATDPTTVLLVPFPYSKLYDRYLAMQIDWANAEIDKYNNDSILFNAAYLEYADWYNVRNMPTQVVTEYRL